MIIKMNKYKEQKEEEKIGRLISSAKMKAPENLKYRIMHQIEYESVLSGDKNIKKKSVNRENGSVLRDLGSIFGTMYAVFAIIAVAAYIIQGNEFYQSIEFWGSIALVAVVFSFFWLFTRIDAHIKEKEQRKTFSNSLSNSEKRK